MAVNLELIGIASTFTVALFNFFLNLIQAFMAGSCRSQCCRGKCCDVVHEEKDDALDCDMETTMDAPAALSESDVEFLKDVKKKCSSEEVVGVEIQERK